jgi:hypothetical protein
MATFDQVGELVTTQLRERVDRLVTAVEEDSPDLAQIAGLADAVGEFADSIAEIYSDLEQALMRRLPGGSGSDDDDESGDTQDEPQSRQESEDAGAEDATKEELLERAREANVQGRSSMTKDELAEAVDAEESLTKEQLLERAREAEIEGRSSMTKDELRSALREAGA